MSVLYDDVQMDLINNSIDRNAKVWNLCSHYQDIYDWILPLNKPSDSWFILTAVYMGEMSMVCLFYYDWFV